MIGVLYFVSIFIAFLYIFLITHILTTWNEIEEWRVDDSFKPDTKISVIIPFRNEAENIKNCIESVLACRYPKALLEVILINDHSDDKGEFIIGQFYADQVVLLSLDETIGKKAAIAKGVAHASHPLIVTTDADCMVQRDWLRNIASYYEYTKHSMIVGMVSLSGPETTLSSFQIMDTCGTMGLHGAGIHNNTHFLANGANFIFEKELFENTKPFLDDQHASGDDVFFVNIVADKAPESISFLKNRRTVVETKTEETWSQLWKQRKRWATKNSSFSKGIYKWLTAAIWLLSLSIIVNIILIPFTGAFSLFVVLTQLLIKGAMDFLYLQNMCKYFDKSKVLKRFIPAFLLQTLYIFVLGLVALWGGKHEWKGRIQK